MFNAKKVIRKYLLLIVLALVLISISACGGKGHILSATPRSVSVQAAFSGPGAAARKVK